MLSFPYFQTELNRNIEKKSFNYKKLDLTFHKLMKLPQYEY